MTIQTPSQPRTPISLVLLAAALVSPPIAVAGTAPLTKVIDVGGEPEGTVVYGDTAFVSNLGPGGSTAPDGDGYISRIDLNGSDVVERFLPMPSDGTLNFPMGMQVVNDVLYVADLDRIVGFDIGTQRRQFELELTGAGIHYLNDLVYVGEDTLIASATNLNALFAVNIKTRSFQRLAVSGLGFVNGLAFDRHLSTLYVTHNQTNSLQNDNGTLTALKLASGAASARLWDLHVGRFLDGVALASPSTLVLSDWDDLAGGGVLHLVTRDGALLRSEHSGQKGLADISYARMGDVLVLPALQKGEVELVNGRWPADQSVTCSLDGGSDIGTITLDRNPFGVLGPLQVNGSYCPLHFSVDGDRVSYYRGRCESTLGALEITATQRLPGNGRVSLEISYPRIPDTGCHPARVCNPSEVGYSYYRCAF